MVTTQPAPGPWLAIRSQLGHLNEDLIARGWGVWHHPDASVTVTAPDGQAFVCESLRAAYETAREYTSTQSWDEVTE